MDEADIGVGQRVGSRARHYHQRRSDDAATEDPAPSGHREAILDMTPESFVQALDHLDPGSRALLDLSLHRGMEDREVAELLGSDPDYVSSSREAQGEPGWTADAAHRKLAREGHRPPQRADAVAHGLGPSERERLVRGLALQRRDRRGPGHEPATGRGDRDGQAAGRARRLPL